MIKSYNLQTTLTFDTEMFRTWSWLCPISPSRRLSRTSRPSPRSQSPSWSWWLAPCCQSRSPSPLPSPRTDTRPHIQSSSHNSRVWIINKISFFEVFKYLWSVNNSYCTQYWYRVSFGIIARGSGCGTEAITIRGAVTSLATPEIDEKDYWWIAVILKNRISYLSGDCLSPRDCCTSPSSW